jgi:nitroreductase
MSTYELILGRRTVRKFKQEKIKQESLEKMVNAARLAPSGANRQPLKYVIVNDEKTVQAIFEQVNWAAYIAPEGTPKKNEQPTSFIAVLADTNISQGGYELEAGAAIQSILLVAKEEGIGSCWMASINRPNIMEILKLNDDSLKLIMVIALGYESEMPITEDEEGSIKYYKDEAGVLHVPKRKLEDVLINR